MPAPNPVPDSHDLVPALEALPAEQIEALLSPNKHLPSRAEKQLEWMKGERETPALTENQVSGIIGGSFVASMLGATLVEAPIAEHLGMAPPDIAHLIMATTIGATATISGACFIQHQLQEWRARRLILHSPDLVRDPLRPHP